MKQFLLTSIQELDRLYYSDSFTEYEQTLQTICQKLQQTLPGFTIAYAEIYTAGPERDAHGGMRHVLLPQQERNDR